MFLYSLCFYTFHRYYYHCMKYFTIPIYDKVVKFVKLCVSVIVVQNIGSL